MFINTEYEAINTGNCFSFSRFSEKSNDFKKKNVHFVRILIYLVFFVADSGTRRPLLAQLFGSNNDDEEQGGGLTSVHQTSG